MKIYLEICVEIYIEIHMVIWDGFPCRFSHKFPRRFAHGFPRGYFQARRESNQISFSDFWNIKCNLTKGKY